MPGNAHERMIELLDEAGQTYFQAMKSGLQIQQDVASWWSDQLADAQSNGNNPQVVITEAVEQWKQNAQQSLSMMEQGTHQSLDLLNKAFEVGHAESIEAAQKKLNELWQQSLQAVQDNVQSTLEANERFAKVWVDLARKQGAQSADSAG